MLFKTIRLNAGLVAIVLLVGCFDDTDSEMATSSGQTLTYYEHVKPIVDAKCVSCHTEGQIGPFVLDKYDDVKAHGLVSKAYVSNKIMPPWPPDNTCNTYKYDRSLTDDQIETFVSWVDGGMHKGDPETTPQTRDNDQDGLSRVDLTLTAEEYTPQKFPDDYRCFLLRWPQEYTERKYVTGFNAIPRNLRSAHHLIAFLVSPDQVAEYERLDANDAGAGYTCFGASGGPIEGIVGSWTPGLSGHDLPDGLGIPIEPGSLIVLQIHYNALEDSPQSDQTSIDLKIDDAIEHEAVTLTWLDLDWLVGDGMLIPAGKPDVIHSVEYDPTLVFSEGKSFDVYKTFIHMHTLGTQAAMTIERSNGDDDCLISIPRWDYNWQDYYELANGPVRINYGDKLKLECHWDNTEENQPLIDGQLLPSQDVIWGEGTMDEMCVGSMLAVVVE